MSVTWTIRLSANLISKRYKAVWGGRHSGRKGGHAERQRGLDRLERWHSAHLMKLNEAKYEIPHLGQGIPKHEYRLGDEWVKSRLTEVHVDKC